MKVVVPHPPLLNQEILESENEGRRIFAPLRVISSSTSLLPVHVFRCRRLRSLAIFMGTECVIEKMRGKSDMMNAVYAGCVTGAAFGIKQGPQAACMGCVGMATFTAVLDKIMGH